MKNRFSYLWLVAVTIIIAQCATPVKKTQIISLINTDHLDKLYDTIVINGDTVGMVHIYAEYPDYHHVGDADEGITCVDDVSRAAIFYLRQFKIDNQPVYLEKARMLIKFVLQMQSPDAYYYNFVWEDGQINKDGITSKPEPNFWSWRALWMLGEAVKHLPADDQLLPEIKTQRKKLVLKLISEENFRSFATDTSMGWTFPTWLPKGSGTDQAAIVLLGLSLLLEQDEYYSDKERDDIIALMRHFGEGMRMMQVIQPGSLADGAFLSWENLWHAYAHIQSYALMEAGRIIHDEAMIRSALYEVDIFFPAILAVDGLDHLWIKVENDRIDYYDAKQFPQIAYGRQPMVWGALKAYETTKDEKYMRMAVDLHSWFSGNNPAHVPMYDPSTGRGYDGIIDRTHINQNAGAESTIESLMSLQLLEYIEKNKVDF